MFNLGDKVRFKNSKKGSAIYKVISIDSISFLLCKNITNKNDLIKVLPFEIELVEEVKEVPSGMEGVTIRDVIREPEPECTHPNKYLNVISKNLQFWVCPDCGKEVKGD